MPVIGGPTSILLMAAVLVAAVALWLTRRREYPGPRLMADDDIDREELDAAEREVRDLDSSQRPEDGFEGDDWGPGTARRPRSPLDL